MKRLLSTVLLACFVLGAWAQNKTKMTEEEKKEAMKQLEVLYQFETGAAFGELDSLTESQEFKQDRLPWEKWADKFKHKSFKKQPVKTVHVLRQGIHRTEQGFSYLFQPYAKGQRRRCIFIFRWSTRIRPVEKVLSRG